MGSIVGYFDYLKTLQLFLRGDRGGGAGDKDKEGKTETSPLEEAQAGPVATDDVRPAFWIVTRKVLATKKKL